MSTRRSYVAVALVCGLSFLCVQKLPAQQPATSTPQTQEVDPLKRQRSDEDQFRAQKELEEGTPWRVQDLARAGCAIHHQ